mmetsp:Transcript_36027/g.90398  ORF Transcript_36027/g.90398 Transcript_36027/m.90398 type:complete len:260 (+) Transcript_36027:1286-2065(+)
MPLMPSRSCIMAWYVNSCSSGATASMVRSRMRRVVRLLGACQFFRPVVIWASFFCTCCARAAPLGLCFAYRMYGSSPSVTQRLASLVEITWEACTKSPSLLGWKRSRTVFSMPRSNTCASGARNSRFASTNVFAFAAMLGEILEKSVLGKREVRKMWAAAYCTGASGSKSAFSAAMLSMEGLRKYTASKLGNGWRRFSIGSTIVTFSSMMSYIPTIEDTIVAEKLSSTRTFHLFAGLTERRNSRKRFLAISRIDGIVAE